MQLRDCIVVDGNRKLSCRHNFITKSYIWYFWFFGKYSMNELCALEFHPSWSPNRQVFSPFCVYSFPLELTRGLLSLEQTGTAFNILLWVFFFHRQSRNWCGWVWCCVLLHYLLRKLRPEPRSLSCGSSGQQRPCLFVVGALIKNTFPSPCSDFQLQ